MVLEFILSIIASLVAGGLAGYFIAVDKYKKKYSAAVESFANDLEKAIISTQRLEVKARTIVSIRDAARDQISNLHKTLNSEIDRLAEQIQVRENLSGEDPAEIEAIDANIKETMDVLVARWPAKKTEIEVAIRRTLAELGLVER